MLNSGIYKITNIINGNIYIGSAKNFTRRFITHKDFLKRKVHPNIHLQRASELYGLEVFIFEILEYVELDKLLEREQFYLDTLKPEYNILKIAGSLLGFKHSEETKNKFYRDRVISKESNAKRSKTQTGVPKSEDHKSKIGIANSKPDKWPCAKGIKCKCNNCKNKRNELRKTYPSYHWGKYKYVQ